MAEAAQCDSSPFFGEGGLVGSRSLRRFSAVRGPEDKRWRVGGEEAHFSLKGVLSPPIISHCPVES